VHVLRRLLLALRPGGLVLDLQVIRPNPRVELDGAFVCEIDGEVLLARADAAAAAVDEAVREGVLVDEAVDDHDSRKYFASGAELVEDFRPKERSIAPADERLLLPIARPLAMRERCRLRRLRLVDWPA
jgi:hypothetical protein